LSSSVLSIDIFSSCFFGRFNVILEYMDSVFLSYFFISYKKESKNKRPAFTLGSVLSSQGLVL
jgi:hypothetical protein